MGHQLWSTFLVGIPDTELNTVSQVGGGRIFQLDSPNSFLLLDLGTREGAWFSPRGMAVEDMRKHAIHVSPLFQGALTWVRAQIQQGVTLENLPTLVEIPPEEVTEALRHAGPMKELLRVALTSPDKKVQEAAKAVWAGSFMSPVPGVPLTLKEAVQWIGPFVLDA